MHAEMFSRKPENWRHPARVGWKLLLRYAQSTSLFTAKPKPQLPVTSFLRLAAVDLADLPKPETFALSDGYPLSFRHYRTMSGNGTAVVLVHGSAGHAGQYHALAREIATHQSMDVYALDMRGHGASALRRGHDVHETGRLIADLKEFLAELRERYPRLVLGGHSAGGGLLLRTIANGIDPFISAYMFFSPYLGLGSPTIRPYFGGWVSINTSLLRAIFLANLFGVTRFNDKTVVHFDLSACPDSWRYTPSWSFNMLLAFGPDIWNSAPLPIPEGKPVLVVAGLNDQCFYPEGYHEAFACLASKADVRMAKNCGHWDILVAPETIGFVVNWLDHLPDQQNAAQITSSLRHSVP